jgi:hypothetical protein
VNTATASATATPKHRKKGGTLYPNPATGDTTALQVDLDVTSDVTVGVFTIAFRKVQEKTFVALGPGVADLVLPLADKTGVRLANGVYYVVLEMGTERSIQKLLILR